MGSPQQEKGRDSNEGPQSRVKVAPFWLGKYEVTWDEYEPFMITPVDRYKNGTRKDFDPAAKYPNVDAVTSPTAPYVEMSFGMGQKGFPAISMTQHGANKYCEWLSCPNRPFLPASDRSRMGIRLPGRNDHRLLVRQRSGRAAEVRLV